MDKETHSTFIRITEAMKRSSDPAMRTIGSAVKRDLERKAPVEVRNVKSTK